MPKVRFTQEPKVPNDLKYKGYKKDWTGEMSQNEADRWINRGVAEVVVERSAPRVAEVKKEEVVEVKEEVKPTPTVSGAQSTVSGAQSTIPGAAAPVVKK